MRDTGVTAHGYIWSTGNRRLCRIVHREQTAPATLSRNRCNLGVGITSRTVRSLHTRGAGTTVCVAHENSSLLVYINPNEVEQVAMRGRSTAEVNAVPLDRIIWSGIGNQPMAPAIEGCCDIQVPYA